MSYFTYFLISFLASYASSAPLTDESEEPTKWALLAATTSGWEYYGHQASVCHAYQTLIANGFSSDNIIIMMYDDIAYHEKNNEQGVIRNKPDGPDVYDGIDIDYAAEAVNENVFLAVLTGDEETASQYEGSGRVIKSGPKDNIFIYVVGLGSPAYLSFPTGAGIQAADFANTLDDIRNDGKANKILVFLDTVNSGSVGRYISRDNNIIAITATAANEVPKFVYCFKYDVCYGSVFGVIFTDHMDRMRLLKAGPKETVFDQFQFIRGHVKTKVSIFGHVEQANEKVANFLGYKHEDKKKSTSSSESSENIKSSERENKSKKILNKMLNDIGYKVENKKFGA